MKTASIKDLKIELKSHSQKKLIDLCARLAKYKKENKELLTYLIFEADDEARYIKNVNEEITGSFKTINSQNMYLYTKGVRKVLRQAKKYIRFTASEVAEVFVLINFCKCLLSAKSKMDKSIVLQNIYQRQLFIIRKACTAIHEDLQYDVLSELQQLESAR